MDEQLHLPTIGPSDGNNTTVPDIARNFGLTLVQPLNTPSLTEDEIEVLWQRVKSQEYMFSDWERGNRDGFIARLLDMRHLHLLIGADGYALLLNAWCCDSPDLHFCIWNPQRPAGLTLAAGRQVLNFAFDRMHAHKINGFMPENHKLSIKFATMLGFKFEGCIRENFLFFGKRYDVHAYGLLEREWRQQQVRRQSNAQ